MQMEINNGVRGDCQTRSPLNEDDDRVVLQEGENKIDGLDINIDTRVNQFGIEDQMEDSPDESKWVKNKDTDETHRTDFPELKSDNSKNIH